MTKRIKIAIIFITTLFLAACGQTIDQTQNGETVNVTQDSSTSPKSNLETSNSAVNEIIDLQKLEVHYIDVGQADATLFQWSEEDKTYTMLYDTGDWKRDDVLQYLDTQGIHSIDLIIISHPDADHIGQLANIINTYHVGEVWMSGNESTSQTFQHAINAILTNDVAYDEPRTGDVFDLGSLTIEVLHPGSISGKANEESISMVVTYGNTKFLFTGDASTREEKQMMSGSIDVGANILQLGHHGSNTSSDLSFIKAVDPEIAIYSAGSDNSYGHPHEEVVSRILSEGITLYGTDVHGTIIVTTDGNEYNIQTKDEGTINLKSSGSSQAKQKDADNQKSLNEEITPGDCIDINKASISELQQIIHIGPVRAEGIIEKRPYDSIDDLSVIDGIGPTRIADIKDQGLACTGG